MPAMYLDVDAALSEVPINIAALVDDTDFKTREESVVFDQSGLDLVWNFVTSAGAFTQTAVTPTDTAGVYDWVNQGNGMYTIEIPASGGGTINNDTEGYGWFSGFATGVLPWIGPVIGFRAAGLNNLMMDNAFSATRGLTGTALPAAVADAAGGVPISDAGGLDLDAKLANTNEVTAARMGALTDWINGGRLDLLLDAIPTTAMRGTDSAALASVCTETRLAALTDWLNGGRLDLLLDAIPTTAMRGTDSAALASALTTAQNDLDTLTGTGGALIATGQTAAAWSSLEASAETIKEGTAAAGTLSTTEMTTGLTEVDDVFNGRILIFKSDTATAALRLQATDITDYANTNGKLTFTAVTTAPASNETFIIV